MPVIKNARIVEGQTPVQVAIDRSRKRLEVFDTRQRRYLSDEETAGTTIQLRFLLDLDLRYRFAAKVALAAGYFAYGELFARCVVTVDTVSA